MGLHVCEACRSELVQPVSWAEASGERWQLTLSCPNCGRREVGLFEREQVDRLEERVDRGIAGMLRDLKRLRHANMAEEIERFVDALNRDLLLPEDF